jgi:hypothetical protein
MKTPLCRKELMHCCDCFGQKRTSRRSLVTSLGSPHTSFFTIWPDVVDAAQRSIVVRPSGRAFLGIPASLSDLAFFQDPWFRCFVACARYLIVSPRDLLHVDQILGAITPGSPFCRRRCRSLVSSADFDVKHYVNMSAAFNFARDDIASTPPVTRTLDKKASKKNAVFGSGDPFLVMNTRVNRWVLLPCAKASSSSFGILKPHRS